MKNAIKKPLTIGLIAILLLCLLHSSVQAKTYRWVLGIGFPAVGFMGEIISDWFPTQVSKRIEAATGDEVSWVKAFGGSLVKVGDELEGMQQGIVTFSYILPMFEPSKLPLGTFCYQTPFSSPDIMMAATAGHNLWKKIPYMSTMVARYNVKYLGMITYDSYQLITTFPIKTIGDIKGHKIAGAGPNLPWIKAVGGVPVQSNLVEGYTSLQTGVYEGWIMFTTASAAYNFPDTAKYQTHCDFGAFPMTGLGMNLAVFDSLPRKIQDILLEIGDEITFKTAKAVKGALQDSIDTMKRDGVTFYQLPFEEKQRWAEKLPDIPNAFVRKYEARGLPAKQVLSYWLDAQKNAGHQFPREWVLE